MIALLSGIISGALSILPQPQVHPTGNSTVRLK